MLETHPKSLGNKRLLVVDNDIDFRNSLQKDLEKVGAKVLVAKGVDEASRILRESDVDFVLSNMHMPLKSGFDLLRWCDSVGITASGRPVPFALMTASAEPVSEESIVEVGACSLLKKPFKYEELVKLILQVTEIQDTEENRDCSFSHVPIPILELETGAKEVRCPLYLIQNSNQQRFISHGMPERLAESSVALSQSQIGMLYRSGLDRVFIRAKESFRFFGFTSKIECYSEREVGKKYATWTSFFQELESAAAFFTSRFKMDAEAFRYSVILAEAAVKLLLHSKDIEASMIALKNENPERYRAALTSALLGVSVMTMMGWESLPVRLQMAFSAILIEIYKSGKITKVPTDIVACISETVLSTAAVKDGVASGVKFKVPPLVSILQAARCFSDELLRVDETPQEDLLPHLKAFAQSKKMSVNPDVLDAATDFLEGGKIRKFVA